MAMLYTAAMFIPMHHTALKQAVSQLLTVVLFLFPLSQTLWGGLLLCVESEGITHIETALKADCLPPPLMAQHVDHHQNARTFYSPHTNTDSSCLDIPLLLSVSDTRTSSIPTPFTLPAPPLQVIHTTPLPPLSLNTGTLSNSSFSKASPLTNIQTVVLLI